MSASFDVTFFLTLSQTGDTPLFLAAKRSRTVVVEMLLNKGAEPDWADTIVSYVHSLHVCLCLRACVCVWVFFDVIIAAGAIFSFIAIIITATVMTIRLDVQLSMKLLLTMSWKLSQC